LVVSAGIVVVDHVASPIDRLPRSGELVLTSGCDLFIGGCAANVAIDLTKLGVPTRVVGAVGRDPLGAFACETLTRAGLDPSHLVLVDHAPTSQTLVVNVRGEDRRFIHLKGANDQWGPDRILETLAPSVRVLYVGGMFLMDGFVAEQVAELFRRGRERGMLTLLDVVTPGPFDYETSLRRILPQTDYFLPNEDESALMTGQEDVGRQGRLFQEWGADGVIITRGERGAVFFSGREAFACAPFPSDFVDGTGGGDAFTAGFISGLVDGLGPVDCVARGSALGASCVRARGATEGVWSRGELEAFLAQNPARCSALVHDKVPN
jgi:sugar/nucleoside kinase (ribokinase family)